MDVSLGKVKLGVLVVGLMGMACACLADDARYMIEKCEYGETWFFHQSPAARLKMFDKVEFVTSYDPGGMRSFWGKPFRQLKEKDKWVMAGAANSTSVQQVDAAKAAGYKVCLGPVKNLRQVVWALQTGADRICIEPDLDVKQMREVIRKFPKPTVTDYGFPVNIKRPQGYTLNYKAAAKRKPGTTLRVMSYNILAAAWNHHPAISLRSDAVLETINHTKPDLIGVQEVDKHWTAVFKANEKSPYQLLMMPVPKGSKSKEKTYSPLTGILYNAERFDLIERGVQKYTDTTIRCLTWGLFEDRATHKRVLFTNTHWDLTDAKRLRNAKQMAKEIEGLRKRFENVPVVSTGDFNTMASSEAFTEFVKLSGMSDAMTSAEFKENGNLSSWSWPVVTRLPYLKMSPIDHVLASSDYTILASRLLVDEKILDASDHLPLVVDLK